MIVDFRCILKKLEVSPGGRLSYLDFKDRLAFINELLDVLEALLSMVLNCVEVKSKSEKDLVLMRLDDKCSFLAHKKRSIENIMLEFGEKGLAEKLSDQEMRELLFRYGELVQLFLDSINFLSKA